MTTRTTGTTQTSGTTETTADASDTPVTIPTEVAAAPGPGILRRLWPVELRKLVDTPAGVVLLGVAALLAGAFGGGEVLYRDGASYGSIARMAGVPGAMLAPVLAVLLVTAERSHHTALTTFALVPRRSAVLAAKALAVITLGVAVTGLSLVAALLITLVGSAVVGHDVPWTVDWVSLGWFTLSAVVAALSGYGVALLVGNGPAAIVIVLVWPFLDTTMSLVPEIGRVLDWADVGAVLRLEDGITGTAVGQAVTGFAVWVVVPVVLGWVRTLRSEVR